MKYFVYLSPVHLTSPRGVSFVKKRFAVLTTAVLLAVLALQPLAAQAAKAPTTPPAPTEGSAPGEFSTMGGTSGAQGNVGDIYYGAIPPNVDYNKPVLVFVHGYSSSAHTWWQETAYHGVNDMYTYAYNNGHRTAFVNLAPDKDMWYNGSLLNTKIDTIRSYYGVSKVTIIAHSKGGVDSNAASVHYGARPKISKIITLGSPHKGTPLSDLAYSSWTWWLAELFGATNDAVYSLQTGYMNYYRSVTPTDTIPYYTFSGYKCGPFNTAMWYGCMAIGGEDDGVVPVGSTRIPGGIHLKEGYWDHDEIKMGSRTWSYFAPYIKTAALATPAVAAEGPLLAAAPARTTDASHGTLDLAEPAGNVILRGGASGSEAPPAFPVESKVRSAEFTIISSSPTLSATLTGPDGQSYTVATTEQVPEGQVFAGAWTATVAVDRPAAGQWNVAADAAETAGYLLVATLDSDLKATLAFGMEVVRPGAAQELTLGFGPGRAPSSSQARAEVARSGEKTHGRPAFAAAGGTHKATVATPDGNAIHNVTATVTGLMDDGSAFERTVVSSFAAVDGPWQGR